MSLVLLVQNTQVLDMLVTVMSEHTWYDELVSLYQRVLGLAVTIHLQMPMFLSALQNLVVLDSEPLMLTFYQQLCFMRYQDCARPVDKVHRVIAHLVAQHNMDDVPKADCTLPAHAVYSQIARYLSTKGINVHIP
jgi:hypothetical protein